MQLLLLPVEVISSVLLELEWKDIARCRLICKFVNGLVKSSTALWYEIELGHHCMINNPSTAQSSSTSLEKLKRFTEAWATLKASTITSFRIPSYWSVYDLQQGIFVHGLMDSSVNPEEDDNHLHHECTTALHFYKFPSTLSGTGETTWSFPHLGIAANEMTIDPSMDLLVLLEKPTIVPPTEPTQRGQVNISVHLRTMTRNEPHPAAQIPVLTQRHVVKWEESFDSYSFSLRGNRLALVVVSCGINYGDEFYIIWIWDWRTGELEFEHSDKGFAALSFLTNSAYLVSHHSYGQEEWALDVHFMTNDNTSTHSGRLKTQTVSLLLPKLECPRILVEGIICRSVPNQASRASNNHLMTGNLGALPEARGQRIVDPKPFRSSPITQVVVVSFNICRLLPQPNGAGPLSIEGPFEEFTLVTRADLLVALAWKTIAEKGSIPDQDIHGKGSPLSIEWEDWGPSNTRFEQEKGCGVSKYVCCTSGQRLLTWSRVDKESFVIWDFNPYCLGPHNLPSKQAANPVPPASIVHSDLFKNTEISTALPYREFRLPVEQRFISGLASRDELDFMLDEENFAVLTKATDEDSTLYTVYTM